MSMECVNRGILDQIYLLRDKLGGNSKFDLKRRHLQYSNLKKESDKHSISIEMPRGGKIGSGRAKRIALRNLSDSYEALAGSCDGKMSESQLKIAASLINFGSPVPMNYRTGTARTLDSEGVFVYPDPQAIDSEMYSFLERLNSFEDIVNRAVYAHFQIARIHPFYDGNGRLSRALQNSLLINCNLPPIVISSLERDTYMDLISKASREYREENGLVKPAQSKFFNYLAMKLWDSLDMALRDK